MLGLINRKAARFPELSYASPSHPPIKRMLIRSVEELSGRDRFLRLYEIWKDCIAPTRERVFSRLLDLLDIRLSPSGHWPPAIPDGPLVIVANHPFGIGDGIALLSLAESLGRPFRVLIHSELLKVPEIHEYALPVDFSEDRDALRRNMEVRHEATRLLREGVTIVVFPAGGVATAPKGLGRAQDLPWKLFPAKLVMQARANVLPVHFSGQNGPLFHLASKVSMTLRTSLLIAEFTRLSGRTIEMAVGPVIAWPQLEPERDRIELTRRLHEAVFALAAPNPAIPSRSRSR
jgi:putative hemolysin